MPEAEIQAVPQEQQPRASAPARQPEHGVDLEAGACGEGATGESTSAAPPSLSQRAVLGFSDLLQRLRRQANSSHERVPSSEDAAGDEAGASPRAVPVITEPGASGEAGPSSSGAAASSPQLGRAGSRGKERVCLICLDALSEEEFRRGEAISLQCGCRGDLALRHKACAVKWVQVKGDNICELCKQPVANLPAPPPRPRPEEALPDNDAYYYDPSLMEMPTSADLMFDCVRVCWVACIISILFFEMSLGAALWTGILAGLAYSILLRLAYRRHYVQIQQLQQQQQQLLATRAAAGRPPTVVVAAV